ncbi:MAG: hypothetical protein NVS1B11_24060 [Terriglobales bacterium]
MHDSRYEARNMTSLVAEIRDELKEFASTRIEMLKAELKEKTAAAKIWAPLTAGAIVLLGTAYLLLTLAIVSLVVIALRDNPFRWFIGFVSVGVVWGLIGGILAVVAWKKLSSQGMFPAKTAKVLNADRIWLQNEAKS